MSSTRVLGLGMAVSFFLGVLGAASPSTADAAWVNSAGTAFQVGAALTTITPTIAPSFLDPTCSGATSLGGTSLAVVSGSKLAGVDPALYPVVLVVSCLDTDQTVAARLNFINPADGKVVKQISTFTVPSTPFAPSTGWAYLVHRQDKGDLLGCGSNGALYSIDYSQTTATVDGTAMPLTSPTTDVTTCKGLAWDAEADVIYVGRNSGTTNDIVRFNNGAMTLLGTPLTDPCDLNAATKGLAISGGVLLVSCEGDATIHRIDKNTGIGLGVHGTLTATGLPVLDGEPGLSSLTCDPVTFAKDATGKDLFTDALWSRRGGSVSALEFPAFTCGMPANSVVVQGGPDPLPIYSPLAAGLGAPSGGVPGAVPKAACFNTGQVIGLPLGQVIDLDGDGLPDCWESTSSSNASPGSGIDFDGDGTVDLQLCVQVNTNGDGLTLTTECAVATHKDLFVEIDWMQDHKPDPKALSQTQSPATLVNGVPVGVKSIREAFAAAPVANPDTPPGTNCSAVPPPNPSSSNCGIRLHMQVDEQVTFNPLAPPLFTVPSSTLTSSHTDLVAFTPCTPPANSLASIVPPTTKTVVDFDTLKAGNFGTATERGTPPGTLPTQTAKIKTLNAKRLAFRYVLFAHNLVGTGTGGGSNGSGCAEIGGDDAVVTLGSFATTSVGTPPVSHPRGTTDQQAGTLMHEYGHTLGFGHGGNDGINCKPNYRSVMSYSRQFAGSPIPNRRLDYSRSDDPVLADLSKTGVLREGTPTSGGGLDESVGLGNDLSLGPIPPFFPSTDVIVFGPNAWSLQTPANAKPINWNRTTNTQTNASANINAATATAGCDGSGDVLFGHDDWGNVLYRASAAINFAGGETSPEMTSDNEQAFYALRDADSNGVGDNIDCGSAGACTHRLAVPDGIAQPANFRIVIFSEKTSINVWNAPVQVITNGKDGKAKCPPLHLPANETTDCTLTVSVGDVVIPVKTPSNGTCSAQSIPDPTTGVSDGIKDMVCQVKSSDQPPLPHGTVSVIVSGFFVDALTSETRAFTARQEVTIP